MMFPREKFTSVGSMNELMNENLVYELINCCSRSFSYSLLLFVSA